MQSRKFGPNGLTASPFCFGAMQFGGGAADEKASAAMYDACRAAGINFFDTAYVYTGGDSERILGRLIAPEREKIILITKVGERGGFAPEHLRSQFDECRSRLGQDTVDILFLHQWREDAPIEAALETLAEFKQQGLIHHVGVSNFAAWQVMKAQAAAEKHGFPRIDILQPMYNLVKRQAEVELLPMALSEDIAVIPYSPLGGGLLTGKYAVGESGRLHANPMYTSRYAPDWMHAAAAALTEIAAEAGVHPATLAVAWAARHPGVTAPIISARTAAQLEPSLAALGYEMDDALYTRLSALTPTPPPANDRLEEQK